MRLAALVLTVLLAVPAPAAPGKRDPIAIPKVSAAEVICFALYAVDGATLKLTAQFYPLPGDAPREARLEIAQGDDWTEVARAAIIEDGWTAPFRVDNWDDTKTARYRVRHGDKATYTGTIQDNPKNSDTFVVAAFTGNSIHEQHGGDIPRTDIVENVKRLKPDLLFFSGDQVYDHKRHYEAWLRFGRDFGDIIRDYPTICIPDDHDVGQANLWGAGGKQSMRQSGDDGGYFAPAAYVNQVQRAQTSHLPDPHDPTPVDQNISVYYTDLTWGGISFAILEDRKWKTGPDGTVPKMGPRPDHIDDPSYDPETIDVPGAVLLGDRQLKFLESWGQDWHDAEMKAVLSQTIFCGGAHIHGKYNNRIHADLDSNGWPQTGRNKALDAIRRSYSVMIAGDQHLGSIFHHGIDEWGDAGYSFCVPSIANLYLRWWQPLEPGTHRAPGAPEYTGRHLDGFANKLTVYAAANPEPEPKPDDGMLTTRAAGFGIVRFDKPARTITFECWPRNVNITDPGARQYPGWPKTIHQEDNYARQGSAWLPTLTFPKDAEPVVQVIDESNGEVLYTFRAHDGSFQPKVFNEGTYAIRIGEGDKVQTLEHLIATKEPAGTLEVLVE